MSSKSRLVSAPKRPPRAGRSDFAALVRRNGPGPGTLPLTHITDAYRFRGVVEDDQLATADCKVFGEPLLYLFYGRPAYRVSSEIEGTGLDSYWPICFVMRAGSIAAKRIFPFDTGAFTRFGDFCHRDMIREDFALDVDPTSPQRLLNLFWKGERAYFDNRDHTDYAPAPLAFEAKSYSQLIRSKATGPFDERNSTIELQYDQNLPLSGNVEAVILPIDFATADIIRKFEGDGALVLPFNTVARHTAANMVGQIYDICRDLYGGRHGKLRCW